MSRDSALRLTLTPRDPSRALLEQLSTAASASAPISGTSRSRWLSAPIIATVLSGGLLVGGTAYAERSHLTPIIDAVIPQPQGTPTPVVTFTVPATPTAPPRPTVTGAPVERETPEPTASHEGRPTAESEPRNDSARPPETQQPSEGASSGSGPSSTTDGADPTTAPTPDGVSSDN